MSSNMKTVHGCQHSKLARGLWRPDELRKDPEMQRLWPVQKSSMTTSTKQDSWCGADRNALASRKEIQVCEPGNIPCVTHHFQRRGRLPTYRDISLLCRFKSNKELFLFSTMLMLAKKITY